MRAEKYASSGKAYCPPSENDTDADETAEDEEDESPTDPQNNSAVRTEINAFFDSGSSVGKTAEKVNQSLDQLSDRIRSFPQDEDLKDNEKRQD
jgi:outer membrane protein OmpA-like peptidoglycan-associated protein